MENKPAQPQCPACGSHDIRSEPATRAINLPSGKTEQVPIYQDTCLSCGEVGDFSDRNDALIKAALKQAEVAAVENSIQFLSSLGLTMAYVERVLGLPQRTIMRWKAGEYSAAAIALLRIVRAYPWLLQVAENHFDERFSQKIVVEQAANILYIASGHPSVFATTYKATVGLVVTTSISYRIPAQVLPFRLARPALESVPMAQSSFENAGCASFPEVLYATG